jgi:predicted transcriptional regulator
MRKRESGRKRGKRKAKSVNPIKKLREYLGYNRADLAELSGINIHTLISWEVGRYHPTPIGWKRLQDTMIDIARQNLKMKLTDAAKFVNERLYPPK